MRPTRRRRLAFAARTSPALPHWSLSSPFHQQRNSRLRRRDGPAEALPWLGAFSLCRRLGSAAGLISPSRGGHLEACPLIGLSNERYTGEVYHPPKPPDPDLSTGCRYSCACGRSTRILRGIPSSTTRRHERSRPALVRRQMDRRQGKIARADIEDAESRGHTTCF